MKSVVQTECASVDASKRDGVDVDKLESDFVTYQAIRSYLRDYRNAEYTPETTDPINRKKRTSNGYGVE
jgi:hypothetical protein